MGANRIRLCKASENEKNICMENINLPTRPLRTTYHTLEIDPL